MIYLVVRPSLTRSRSMDSFDEEDPFGIEKDVKKIDSISSVPTVS